MTVLIEDVVECFYLRDRGKLFCFAEMIDLDEVDESGENLRYVGLIKVDKFRETTLDQLPEVTRLLVNAMLGKEGG